MATRGEVRRLAGQRYWRVSAARVVVEAWRHSGEPLAGFARRHGIPRQRLQRWVRRLGGPHRSVRFHRVRLVERGLTQTAPAVGAPIEVEWASGRLIRVMPGFAVDDLARVLEVLEARDRC
jgi:hypothetical protein